MTVLLNITTVPQDFAAGTFNTAATAINGGKWRITFTPTAASSTYTGGNFHSLLGQPHGGLWLNDASLELYTTPDDNIAVSFALTWSAGQPITLSVDARAGHMTATVSGATTGNGTVSLSAGPYIDAATLLEVGRQNGGTNFEFVGSISPIDDGISSDAITAAAVAVAGGTVADKIGFKDTAGTASMAIAGANVSEGRGGNSDGVTAATIAVAGQAISVKRATADFISSAHADIAGANVLEGQGGRISLGPTALDFQRFGFADRPSSIVLNTPASGAVVLLCAGGKSSDVSTPWSDSKNAAAPVTIGALVEYSDFTGYGTIVAVTPAPMTGGTGQTFTQPVTTGDEDTTFGLVAFVAGGHPRVTEVHNNVSNASGGTTQTSPSISIDDEALLVAYWWGASPVVPPFSSPSPGVGTPYTAVPNNGYTVAQSYLVNNEFGEVQAAMAYLYVPAGSGPTSRNVTWTHSPAQGAQLRLVAVQPALADAVTSASLALAGQSVSDRVTYHVALTAAALAVAGGSITEGIARMDNVTGATLALAGGSVPDRRTFAVTTTPAVLALAGGAVADQVAHNQKDTVAAAALSLSGGAVADRVAVVEAITASSTSVAGGNVLDRRALADAVSSSIVALVGQVVSETASNNPVDAVLPAPISLVGGATSGRVARVVTIATGALALAGSDVAATIARRVTVQAAVVAAASGVIADKVTYRAVPTAASAIASGGTLAEKITYRDTQVAVIGGTIQDVVSTGAQDSVLPASLAVVGAAISARAAHAVVVTAASSALRGGDVQAHVASAEPASPPPIPPGRAEAQLVGHVVVPSIESRESQLAHLYGVVRNKDV